MKHLSKTFLALFLLGFAFHAFAQENTKPNFIENELEQYIEDALETWNLPGVAVAIVKDGEVVMAKGFGLQHHQKEEAVDENTLFMIASNTKAFTGHALALLEYQDRCSLDDKLVKYVPGFAMNEPWLSAQVNLNDVLSHRLGLETFQGDFLYFYSDMSKKEVYDKFPKIVPTHGFREEYGYCNVGYFWAGEAIESITGDKWYTFIEDNFVEPLDMNRTQMLSAGIADMENMAAPHTLQNGVLTAFPPTNIDLIGPAASMSSSAADLSHWLIAQLDSGRYEGQQVIPMEVLKETRKPRIARGRSGHIYNRSHYSLYGLGWSMEDYEGYEIISHGGGKAVSTPFCKVCGAAMFSISAIPAESICVRFMSSGSTKLSSIKVYHLSPVMLSMASPAQK
jgi:CubicO group peptidase (beta-lactamase class C family)